MEMNENLLQFLKMARRLENLEFIPSSSQLTKTEFRMIREIIVENKQDSRIISSELARRLGVTRSAISQIVNKMEARGIVKRVASSTDKKIAYIELSDFSVAAFEEQCKLANDYFTKLVKEFGEDKMKKFMQYCAEFTDAAVKVHDEMKAKQK